MPVFRDLSDLYALCFRSPVRPGTVSVRPRSEHECGQGAGKQRLTLGQATHPAGPVLSTSSNEKRSSRKERRLSITTRKPFKQKGSQALRIGVIEEFKEVEAAVASTKRGPRIVVIHMTPRRPGVACQAAFPQDSLCILERLVTSSLSQSR
ncbi:hypothetical protein BC832DRAFT_556978 [Gaertneriomyces semiglobifer]|nr:hypothetical protein BC832DRAFT_556978 [Gaertneriomyces semiglobifer]